MLWLPQDSREEGTYCALNAGQGFLSITVPAFTKVVENLVADITHGAGSRKQQGKVYSGIICAWPLTKRSPTAEGKGFKPL